MHTEIHLCLGILEIGVKLIDILAEVMRGGKICIGVKKVCMKKHCDNILGRNQMHTV